jgi:hypothetical protein
LWTLSKRYPLAHNLCRPADVTQRYGQQRDDDHQRPQAELEPAAVAFGRIGFHRRIIPGRERAEQEDSDAGYDTP